MAQRVPIELAALTKLGMQPLARGSLLAFGFVGAAGVTTGPAGLATGLRNHGFGFLTEQRTVRVCRVNDICGVASAIAVVVVVVVMPPAQAACLPCRLVI